MAVARRRGAADRRQDGEGHEAAIERLRQIAETGLDGLALDGLEKIEQDAAPSSVASRVAVDGASDGASDGAGGEAGGEARDGASDEAGERARAEAEVRARLRIVEALLFAAPEPLSEKRIGEHLPAGTDVPQLMERLAEEYRGRGVGVVRVAGKWAFRTAEDLSYLLERFAVEQRRLSKAALETLAIIAYHQPVTRAEIEDIRGVQTSRGTLDALMETNWVRPRGRRRGPGRPVTYATTDAFLSHFGLDGLGDLPGLAEFKGAGLLDGDLPADFAMPSPKDLAALLPDELALVEDEEDDRETGEADQDAEDADDGMADDGMIDDGMIDDGMIDDGMTGDVPCDGAEHERGSGRTRGRSSGARGVTAAD